MKHSIQTSNFTILFSFFGIILFSSFQGEKQIERPANISSLQDTIPLNKTKEVEKKSGASVKESEEEVFMIVEDHPRFPGCEKMKISKYDKEICAQKKMLEYLFSNLEYPEEAMKNNTAGKVIVQFVVNKKGYIENITLIKDIGDGCGEAAIKVVQGMNDLPNRWKPGMQRGRPVKVKYTLPINFTL
jgi:TonB family protein